MRLLIPVAALLALLPAPVEAKDAPVVPGKVHHLRTKAHDRPYSLFVPSKYSKKASWPLVISSHGRGGEGKREMRSWQGVANTHGFIVACPDMVTATNHRPKTSALPAAEEDDQVLLSIFEEVSSRFRVNRRAVMVTGFSGGGNPSYHSGLRHPDVFTHICTRGGNFAPQQIPSDKSLIEAGRASLHIYIFFGDKDHVLIIGDQGDNGQAYMARDALKKAGYENIDFDRVDGMKHESRPRRAAEWFGKFLVANKKRFKAGDKADGWHAKAAKALERKRYANAISALKKAMAIETKSKLRPAARAALDAINATGLERLEQAKARHAEDPKAALKLASTVARDFRGLPACDEAKSMIAEWKQ